MYIEKALSRLKFEKVPLLVVAIALGHRDGEWKSGLESSPGAFLPYPEIPEEAKGRTVENDEEGCISVCSGAGPCHAQNQIKNRPGKRRLNPRSVTKGG